MIEQWELSPSFLCANDCVGCPDRVSLYKEHLAKGGKPETKMPFDWWSNKVEEVEKNGGTYGMLIGGELSTAVPWLPLLMSKMIKMKTLDPSIFTDGISSYSHTEKGPSTKFKELVEHGLLDMTVHVSCDYLYDTENLPDPSGRTNNSRKFKSAYGIWLAKKLVELGAKRVVMNTTIKADNIDEVIPIYEFCKSLRKNSNTVVLYTFAPWQHNPHVCRGDIPKNYPQDDWLNQPHFNKLKKVSEHILDDTWKRIKEKEERIAGNSSGYIQDVNQWINQRVGCYEEPGIRAVTPDGTERLCPIMTSLDQVLKCWGCSYGFTDRVLKKDENGNIIGNRWTPTRGCEENVDYFLNLIQSTKRTYPFWR